jgi:hypothetical protein
MDSSDFHEISNPDPKYVVSSISQSEQLLAAIGDPGDGNCDKRRFAYNALRNTCLAKRLARYGDFPTLYVDPYTN